MRKKHSTLTSRLLALAVGIPVALGAALAQAQEVDPAAVQALKRMTDHLSGLEQFQVHTQVTLEDILETGQRVDIDIAAKVAIRRPNKARVERLGEMVDLTFYYDGATLTLFSPAANVFATEEAPATIEETLYYAGTNLNLLMPASDLVHGNIFEILMQNMVSASIVGSSVIGGTVCTHLAFMRTDVQFQVWVAEGEEPLPCKYVVTDISGESMVSTVSVLSDWDTASEIEDEVFTFVPPDDAKRIEFLQVGNE